MSWWSRIAAPARRRWPELVVAALALLALFKVYVGHDYSRNDDLPRGTGSYRPYIAAADGHKIYLSVRSLVFDRDLDLDNDIDRFGYSGGVHHSPDGEPYFPHGLGPVLVWAPTLAIAHGVTTAANALGADVPDHGYSLMHQRIVLSTSLVFALLAAFFGASIARRAGCGRLSATVSALAILFGTAIYYYAVYQPSYAHAMDAFFNGLFLWMWARRIGEPGWRRFAGLGALLGMAALVRIAALFLGVVIAVELVAGLWRRGGSTMATRLGFVAGRGGLALGVALLVLLPQFLIWKSQTGHFLGSPNGAGYVSLDRPMVVELLFSSVNGFFSTHPLAYLGTVGLAFAPRAHRLLAGALLAALLLQVYVNSCVYDWFAMGSFGARRLVGVTAILVVGVAFALSAAARLMNRVSQRGRWPARVLGVTACAWFVIWNLRFARDYLEWKVPKLEPHRTCCATAPEFMRPVAEPIYDAVGNPFAWPASALFALRHDVDIQQWDTAVGDYAVRPNFRDLRDGDYATETFYWNLPGANFGPYLVGGFGPRQRVAKKNYRWTTAPAASFFLPLFLAAPHSLELRVAANVAPGEAPMPVRVRLNGDEVARAEVGARWQAIDIALPASKVQRGTNVVTIESLPGPYATVEPSLRPAPDAAAVGVAVRGLRLRLLGIDR